MFTLQTSPSTSTLSPLSLNCSPPSSYAHTPLLTFDNTPFTMGNNIEGTSAVSITPDPEATRWAELAHLRQELNDTKKVIQALQQMMAENALQNQLGDSTLKKASKDQRWQNLPSFQERWMKWKHS
jgi:hypothetical protein